MKNSKRGVTLIEVMLAGAITALVLIFMMQGVFLSVKVCRENSELLAAEAYAWDTAWKWLNKKNEDLASSEPFKYYPDNGFYIASNECPVIYRSVAVETPKCYVCVSNCSDDVKYIFVNVEWGATAVKRYRLNNCVPERASANDNDYVVYNVPIVVYKCSIDRGEELE